MPEFRHHILASKFQDQNVELMVGELCVSGKAFRYRIGSQNILLSIVGYMIHFLQDMPDGITLKLSYQGHSISLR